MFISEQFDTTCVNDYTEHNNSVIAAHCEYIRHTTYIPKQLVLVNETILDKIDFIKAEMLFGEEENISYRWLVRLIKETYFQKEIKFVIKLRKIISNQNKLGTVNFLSRGLFRWMGWINPKEFQRFKCRLCKLLTDAKSNNLTLKDIEDCIAHFISHELTSHFIKL